MPPETEVKMTDALRPPPEGAHLRWHWLRLNGELIPAAFTARYFRIDMLDECGGNRNSRQIVQSAYLRFHDRQRGNQFRAQDWIWVSGHAPLCAKPRAGARCGDAR